MCGYNIRKYMLVFMYILEVWSCVLLSLQVRWWFVGREERGKPSF